MGGSLDNPCVNVNETWFDSIEVDRERSFLEDFGRFIGVFST